jgi:hypothetical protein
MMHAYRQGERGPAVAEIRGILAHLNLLPAFASDGAAAEFERALIRERQREGIALAAQTGFDSLANWGDLALDGSDKAGGRLCYRLSVTDPATSEQLFLWLAVTGSGEPRIELVKVGVGLDDDEPIAATLFEDWRTVGETRSPQRLRFVSGLAEKTTLSLVRVNTKRLNEVFAQEFEKP